MRNLIAASLLLPLAACSPASAPGADPAVADDVPLVAVWRAHDGQREGDQAPFLRVAIWNDGRALFAEDPDVWGHSLREAAIDPAHLAGLKAALASTNIFDLEGYCYLVPDAPMNCVLVRLDGKEQILYWDEVEKSNYGININPQARHRQFMATWRAVNTIAIESLPAKSVPATNPMTKIPESWYVKRAIQSR